MPKFFGFLGILVVLTGLATGLPGCFDDEPVGIQEDEWTSISKLSRNGMWIFDGAWERLFQFSEKQEQIQGSQCAGANDIDCDGALDE